MRGVYLYVIEDTTLIGCQQVEITCASMILHMRVWERLMVSKVRIAKGDGRSNGSAQWWWIVV